MTATMTDNRRIPARWLTLAASLRGQLLLLWLFIVVLCAFMAIILIALYQGGSAAQIDSAQRAVRAGCESIRTLYAANAVRPGTAIGNDVLTVLVNAALNDASGVEGGVWDSQQGFLAYAFPTHGGVVPKLDMPSADVPWIAEHVEKSAAQRAVIEDTRRGAREAVILTACPLEGEPTRIAWSMTRVRTASPEAFDRLTWGLALLLGFALISGGWLGVTLSRWSRGITRLETTLAAHPAGELPPLQASGHKDIDRIIDALNSFTRRLSAARDEAASLTRKLAQSERLASLGRIAAGIAHEIRNPIAAMRLKAENALAHSPERQQAALETVLDQIDRLNELCESLLSLARPLRLEVQEVAISPWLAEHLRTFADRAQRQGITVRDTSDVAEARFDPAQLGRALDNLILNAVQHTPAGGQVLVSVTRAGERLRLTVSDTGSGIPDEIRDHLFEPFVSGRSGGTGLGLAIAREIAEAHGGFVRMVPSAAGAVIELDIPWRAS